MTTTEYIEGTIYYVAEQLSIFLESNGYPGVYAIAIWGNPKPNETHLQSYLDQLKAEEEKHKKKITKPLHKALNGCPATILIIGDTIGLSFTIDSDDIKVLLWVDKKTSAYDLACE